MIIPRVSVVMPMYNGLPYVGEAIESIINQTFQDWELLVINDASTDDSPDVVRGYAAKDNRIKLIDNNTGFKGEGPARNCGIDNATGEYVAMMDADDISLPKRLEEQVKFMDRHPKVVISECFRKNFGEKSFIFKGPTSTWTINALLTFTYKVLPFNALLIFRRANIHERYNTARYGTDVHFVIRVALKHRMQNLPKILGLYRVHANSISFKVDQLFFQRKLFEELLPLRLGFEPSAAQLEAHLALLGHTQTPSTLERLHWIIYAIIHGKHKPYERVIITIWGIKKIITKIVKLPLKPLKLLYKHA